MTRKDILLVLPNLSVYENMSVESQLLLEGRIQVLRKLAADISRQVCCFAEDQLAGRLLFGEVRWVSVLSDADSLWLASKDALYDYLLEQGVERVGENILRETGTRYPYRREMLRGGDQDLKLRAGILQKRIRYACNRVMSDANCIAFVRMGDSFCSVPKPTMGDGRRIVFANENSETHYYSGLAMERELFLQAVKGEATW